MPDFTERFLREVNARIAMANGSADSAIGFFRERREENEDQCMLCNLFDLAYAYDIGGQSDSAIAYYRKHLETSFLYRMGWDTPRALMLRRLGELYEERGENDRAAEYYADFVALWEDGDPLFQAQVEDVRIRIARLVGERGR